MHRRTLTVLAGLTLFTATSLSALSQQTATEERAIIVFDGSGSMWGQIDGVAKIVTARQTLSEIVRQLPANMSVGMIAYGHNRKGDCGDIETLVPVGPAASQANSMVSAVESLQPKGKTPLTDAVRRAAEELRYQEEKATVILVTDGIETCEADPCAVASELEAQGINFTTHVIGFGLSQEEGRQVACLAENTGGRYLPASSASGLSDALKQTVAVQSPAPAEPAAPVSKNLLATVSMSEGGPALTDTDGVRVRWSLEPADGSAPITPVAIPRLHERHPPGSYRLVARTDRGSAAAADIELTDTDLTEINLVFGAGKLDLYAAMMNPGLGLSDTDFLWEIENLDTGDKFTQYTQAMSAVVPSGRYRARLVITRLQKMSPGTIDVEVLTGETSQAEIVAPTSKVLLRAFNPDGSELKRFDVRFAVYSGTNPNDKEAWVKQVIGGDPLFLLPGEYTVEVQAWDQSKRSFHQAFIVEAAKEQTFDLTFKDPAK